MATPARAGRDCRGRPVLLLSGPQIDPGFEGILVIRLVLWAIGVFMAGAVAAVAAVAAIVS